MANAAQGLSIIIFSLNASSKFNNDQKPGRYLIDPGVHYGFGKHMWDIIPQDNITKGYKVCLLASAHSPACAKSNFASFSTHTPCYTKSRSRWRRYPSVCFYCESSGRRHSVTSRTRLWESTLLSRSLGYLVTLFDANQSTLHGLDGKTRSQGNVSTSRPRPLPTDSSTLWLTQPWSSFRSSKS